MKDKLVTSVVEAWVFFRKRGIWGTMRAKDAPWLVQFGKYGICGVMATVVAQVLFFWFAHVLFPAMDKTMDVGLRARNWTYDNLVAFIFANTFVYIVNLAFVFEGGRHNRIKEFGFFTLVNLLAMVPALVVGVLAIYRDQSTPFAQLLFVIVAVMVNFLARKFFVFKG